MTALPRRHFTPQEYLELEAKSDYKSQYIAGEIYAMSGATDSHVTIQSNLIGELRAQFRRRACKVYPSDMRVATASGGLYTYPDASALCGETKFDYSSKPGSLLNPQVIFEVLSPSTEAFDRGEKFARYRKINSLSDYVLVSSDRIQVEHYVRQEGGSWTLTAYDQLGDRVPLRSVACQLPLEEIYDKVTFDLSGDGS